jgi:hypothetical protein
MQERRVGHFHHSKTYRLNGLQVEKLAKDENTRGTEDLSDEIRKGAMILQSLVGTYEGVECLAIRNLTDRAHGVLWASCESNNAKPQPTKR